MARTKSPARVLIVCTSTRSYEATGHRTGLWLSELTHFWDVLTEAGHDVTIASIAGGEIPLDPESLASAALDASAKKRYEDPAFMTLLQDTPSIDEVAEEEWDVVYLAGGHGAMFDFPYNRDLGSLLTETIENRGIVSAVCHGPAGFVGAQFAEGTPLLVGTTVTGFSWPEEKLVGRDKAVPFRLDEALKAEGAGYTKALRPFAEKVVKHSRLVTGQNPASAAGVGKAVVKLLAKKH